VEQDVEVDEMVGDDGAGRRDVSDDVEGDVHAAQGAGAEAAEPGGTICPRLRTRNDQLSAGIGEQGNDFDSAEELTDQTQAVISSVFECTEKGSGVRRRRRNCRQ